MKWLLSNFAKMVVIYAPTPLERHQDRRLLIHPDYYSPSIGRAGTLFHNYSHIEYAQNAKCPRYHVPCENGSISHGGIGRIIHTAV